MDAATDVSLVDAPEPALIAITPPADTPERLSATDAARLLRSLRRPKDEQSAPERATDAAQVEQQESTAQAGDAAPPDVEATGETQANDPAAQQPSIEPPRSWSKEARERWSKLDPETQAYLLERDRDDSAAVRKAQNDAAEQRKALEAERSKVEQARQYYEAALPQLLATLQQQQAGEFADIRTIADVERLAREDYPRYLQWDLAQKKIAAVQQEAMAAQQRQAAELTQRFTEFAQREDSLLAEKVPEMADSKKAAELQNAALAVLKSTGFNEQELAASWRGEQGLSLRDHRVQLLILDATRWREAQAKAKQVQAKPVPPVQRPGVAQGKNAAREAEIANLDQKLERTGSLKDAAALLRARRAAAR
jgi:hypothetical protein